MDSDKCMGSVKRGGDRVFSSGPFAVRGDQVFACGLC